MLRHSLLRASVASAASIVNEPRSSTLVALLPPAAGVALADVEAVSRCISGAAALAATSNSSVSGAGAQSAVAIIREPELGFDVSAVDLASKSAELSFSCAVKLPVLSLHIKDVGRFLKLEITILDSGTGELRRLELSNKQSVLRVNATYASLPLELVSGWNLVRLDVARMARAAFGATYAGTTEITVFGVCRVAKVFFSDRAYEDAELPIFLRAIPLPLSAEALAKQGV